MTPRWPRRAKHDLGSPGGVSGQVLLAGVVVARVVTVPPAHHQDQGSHHTLASHNHGLLGGHRGASPDAVGAPGACLKPG